MRLLWSVVLMALAVLASLLMDSDAAQEMADEATDMFGGER